MFTLVSAPAAPEQDSRALPQPKCLWGWDGLTSTEKGSPWLRVTGEVLPTSHPSIPARAPTPDQVLGPSVDTRESSSTGRRHQGRRSGVDGGQSEKGTLVCGPRTVEWGLSVDSEQQEDCGRHLLADRLHP